MLNQGRELCENPLVHKILKQCECEVQPAGARASNQNRPVERNHRATANHIRCPLDGANLEIKFWPCAFHHMTQIPNGSVGCGQTKLPMEMVHKRKESVQNFRTFGASGSNHCPHGWQSCATICAKESSLGTFHTLLATFYGTM